MHRVFKFILAIVFVVGLGLLLYPGLSDLYNQARNERLISSYKDAVATVSESEVDAELEAAKAYNASLTPHYSDAFSGEALSPSDAYWQLLNVNGDGIMGYVSIPKIDVHMPLYHGCTPEVLLKGFGHLYGTSLPVGSAVSHCVIAGHRGVPSQLFLTHMDEVELGDTFYVSVLDKTYVYEVDQIKVIRPTEVGQLETDPSFSYLTFVTCTPYGANSHRLLVRGHVVEQGSATEISLAERSDTIDWPARAARSFGINGIIAVLAVVAAIIFLIFSRHNKTRA